jgi:phosphoribosyl-ATP pyrophosphohydrolase
MSTHAEMVREFMVKHLLTMGLPLPDVVHHYSPEVTLEAEIALQGAANKVSEVSTALEELLKGNNDPRLCRVHLILEEAAELAIALAEGNEVKALDALADLEYVVKGTGVAFDLPTDAAFAEVHRSNMTKAVRRADDPRLRNKGSEYTPPDLAAVLFDHRSRV